MEDSRVKLRQESRLFPLSLLRRPPLPVLLHWRLPDLVICTRILLSGMENTWWPPILCAFGRAPVEVRWSSMDERGERIAARLLLV